MSQRRTCLSSLLFTFIAMPAFAQAPAIVSERPEWTARTAWRVEAQPFLRIGVADGEDAYLLDGVMGVVRLGSGGIAVATMGGSDVRIYDARGRFVGKSGRRGQGPGEFSQVMGMQRGANDSLIVMDGTNRLNVFAGNGSFARTVTLQRDGAFASPAGHFADGRILSTTWPQGREIKGSRWVEEMELFIAAPDGTGKRRIGALPAAEFAPSDRYAAPVQFGKLMSIAVGAQHFYHSFGDAFEIRQYDPDGRLVRTLRRAWTPRPVTKADIDSFREDFVNAPNEGGSRSAEWKQFREMRFAQMTFAETFAPIRGLRLDTQGNIWARHHTYQKASEGGRNGFGAVPLGLTRYSVFSGTTGKWLGELDLPARFNPMEIGSDYVAGVARDGDGVEYVVVYRLVKPA
ncbi:MAG TPA: hypothetical protein VK928_00240 [Longimicrobiales bacterium]|nr:hypothetical protein [Longimicrobiales bacterium]